ncbi:MAG: MarR family transcriptional regulator [Pseudotabrizicola sp.]|uniref:MarR family winged helix-turn-helix transcriptional regulator n=1 Tax=Pseudotabrizicola sp. TaxID=2939647 RepID=UPI00272F791F|nr:MarR family transcriptional regulator [Pseudotabrizicola sp.]MDP2081513.1 MarR family transcriptional regulator [Pseudotabrizicola sp.]MDZ7575716.1 MarR family transcriptional regulator [Pseudotabrizicola sp.]
MQEQEEVQAPLISLLILAARIVEREFAEALAPFSLAPAQFAIIDLLDRTGDLRPAVIARALDVETSTITLSLKRAERDGLVSRVPDPTDARSILISLCPDGLDRLLPARKAMTAVEDRLTEGLTQEHRAALRFAMNLITKQRR